MIVYKDVLSKLKEVGYNTNRLRKEKILSEKTLSSLRHNKPISTNTLNVICKLTKLQVQDIIEYREDEEIKME